MWFNGRLTRLVERKDVNHQFLCSVDEVHSVREAGRGEQRSWSIYGKRKRRRRMSWPVSSKLRGYEADVKGLQWVCLCVGYLPVLSGIDAWSVFLSFLKIMLPNWSTEDTTFNMATDKRIQNRITIVLHECV